MSNEDLTDAYAELCVPESSKDFPFQPGDTTSEEELRTLFPDSIFIGWDREQEKEESSE